MERNMNLPVYSEKRAYFKSPKRFLRILIASLILSIPAKSQKIDLTLDKLQQKIRRQFDVLTKDQDVEIVKVDQLKQWMESDSVILIDVREKKEQLVSMLPGAITTEEFAEKYKGGIPEGKKIVTYCTIGYRSGEYAMELKKMGLEVYNLYGGVLSWSHKGQTFINRGEKNKETNRVHVYGKDWNFLHPDYHPVW